MKISEENRWVHERINGQYGPALKYSGKVVSPYKGMSDRLENRALVVDFLTWHEWLVLSL